LNHMIVDTACRCDAKAADPGHGNKKPREEGGARLEFMKRGEHTAVGP
jgi:hypothetical protein